MSETVAGNSDFKVGEVCYSVYFADDDLLFPFVGSYVYIGKDLLGQEKAATWYFQDCESYARSGSFLDGAVQEMQVLGLTRDGVSNITTLEGLVEELRLAGERRQAG